MLPADLPSHSYRNLMDFPAGCSIISIEGSFRGLCFMDILVLLVAGDEFLMSDLIKSWLLYTGFWIIGGGLNCILVEVELLNDSGRSLASKLWARIKKIEFKKMILKIFNSNLKFNRFKKLGFKILKQNTWMISHTNNFPMKINIEANNKIFLKWIYKIEVLHCIFILLIS